MKALARTHTGTFKSIAESRVTAQNLLADLPQAALQPNKTVVEESENKDLPVKNEQLQSRLVSDTRTYNGSLP
ncbi:hypothetical protein [Endozoicomonas ascidiicola]|uniref:hypothetical protein n=1 Tax=Endozoicomonas ascidiicola TaxID=1698521 RepID=UPI0008301797|nr:hypothetical protein [Endozoicomonas ascidiicola]USN26988.1 hypothetical protein [synthetic construct]